MFERDPLFGKVSSSNLAAYRDAKQEGARGEEVREGQIQRELTELDAAIVGMDAARMQALREWAELWGPEDAEPSGVMRRPG